jgi:hypothetical protein
VIGLRLQSDEGGRRGSVPMPRRRQRSPGTIATYSLGVNADADVVAEARWLFQARPKRFQVEIEISVNVSCGFRECRGCVRDARGCRQDMAACTPVRIAVICTVQCSE